MFLRRFKADWTHYKSNPFEWIVNEYQQEKNIQIIGTPKSIGQAKIVGEIIEKLNEATDISLQNVAIVLGEESDLDREVESTLVGSCISGAWRGSADVSASLDMTRGVA